MEGLEVFNLKWSFVERDFVISNPFEVGLHQTYWQYWLLIGSQQVMWTDSGLSLVGDYRLQKQQYVSKLTPDMCVAVDQMRVRTRLSKVRKVLIELRLAFPWTESGSQIFLYSLTDTIGWWMIPVCWWFWFSEQGRTKAWIKLQSDLLKLPGGVSMIERWHFLSLNNRPGLSSLEIFKWETILATIAISMRTILLRVIV